MNHFVVLMKLNLFLMDFTEFNLMGRQSQYRKTPKVKVSELKSDIIYESNVLFCVSFVKNPDEMNLIDSTYSISFNEFNQSDE